MPEVFQIIGSILLLVVGVGVILYVLFRKSPVKNEEPETPLDAEEPEEETEDAEVDDIPEGETPAEITRDGKTPTETDEPE